MSSECDLAFGAMTVAELREAGQYIDAMRRQLAQSRMIEYGHVAATEGPWLALAGLELAWLREVTRRYGGPEWEIGMPTSNHAHAQLLDYLEARCDTIHASERHISVETRSMRICDDCERRLPLSEFAVIEGYHSVICGSCASGRDARRAIAEERKPEIEIPEAEQRTLAQAMADGLHEPEVFA
jgi:hypothetical protein